MKRHILIGMGAAMLARAGETGEPLRKLAGEWIKTSEVSEPRAQWADCYEGRFEKYKQLYQAMRALS